MFLTFPFIDQAVSASLRLLFARQAKGKRKLVIWDFSTTILFSSANYPAFIDLSVSSSSNSITNKYRGALCRRCTLPHNDLKRRDAHE